MSKHQEQLRSVLNRLITMRVFTWEQIGAVFFEQVVMYLEQMLPHAGSFFLESTNQPPLLDEGFELGQILTLIEHNSQVWQSLAPQIPGMDAIPYLHPNLEQAIAGKSKTPLAIAPNEELALRTLQQDFNSRRTLVEIGERRNCKPLQVAKLLIPWVKKGWIAFEDFSEGSTTASRPTILVVDDSDLMQQMITHALSGQCGVLVADNAIDALSTIYHEPVSLLLLDVSMPVMDGLELCRTVRGLPQFKDLPIIMLTARDGFFDKVKGRMAGTTEYLTKPFDTEQLRQVVFKHLQVPKA